MTLVGWFRERFPLTVAAVLLPVYLVVLISGRELTHPGASTLRPGDAAGFLGVWAFFLMVRIIDDHKDYADDLVRHPDRMLQRGAVTPARLKVLAAAAVLVQAGVVLRADDGAGRIGLWWLLTMGWVALAARDFFLGPRIGAHPVLYPVLHLPLSGLVGLWIAQLGAGSRALPAAAGVLAGLGIVVAGVVDLTRKLIPAEGAGRSYTEALGARRAAAFAALAIVILTLVLEALLHHRPDPAPPGTAPALVLLAIGPLLLILRFALAPVPVQARRARPARAGLALIVPVQLTVSAAALLHVTGRS